MIVFIIGGVIFFSSKLNKLNIPLSIYSVEMTEMTGIQALLAAASRCRIDAVYGVPGSPITAVVQAFLDSDEFSAVSGWFNNEKVAFEWGLGTSFAGKRSIVAVKHVGMNILADPLMTAMIHTIGAGLVILAGDDPEVTGSQNSQDTRYYGGLARTIVYDPATPQDVYDYLEQAFLMSEKLKAPVIVRLTDAVLKDCTPIHFNYIGSVPAGSVSTGSVSTGSVSAGSVSAGSVSAGSAPFGSAPVGPIPETQSVGCDLGIWNYRMKGRYQRSHFAGDDLLFEAAAGLCSVENYPAFGSAPDPKKAVGLIASGKCFVRIQNVLASIRTTHPSLAQVSFSVMKLGIVSPLPLSRIREFLESHDTIVVVEESESYIEDQIRVFGGVLGKRTGHLPFGNVGESDILSALECLSESFVGRLKDIEIYRRSDDPYFCDGCLYPQFYEMLKRLKQNTGVSVTGDVGCSMYGIVLPYFVLDSAVALGSSIGIGSGVSRTSGQKSIAVIGDFGFFHSGLLGLAEAVHKDVPLLVYVMYNSAAAMTGGQETYEPEEVIQAVLFGDTGKGRHSLHSVSFDKLNGEGLKETLEKLYTISFEELRREGISVIIVRWMCRNLV